MASPTPHPVYVAERAARRAAARVQERNIAYYAANPREIHDRLAELDSEMDVERAMDVYALRAAAIGAVLSVLRGRSWSLVPLAAAAMLGVQATTGDSALRGLMLRLGYRTAQKIAAEEDALMNLLDEGTEQAQARPNADGGTTAGADPATGPKSPASSLI